MRRWARLERLASRAVDGRFGEDIRFEPMATSQYAGATADPDRPAFTVAGILETSADEDDLSGTGTPNAMRSRIRGVGAIARVPETAMPAYPLRKGDRVTAIDRNGTPTWSVVRVDPDQLGRVVIGLAPL
jgi:hypothetical protein